MSRLGHSGYRQLIAFLGQLHQPTRAEDFGRHLVRLLSEAIPGATIALDEIDPLTGAYRLSHNSQADEAILNKHFVRLTEVYQQNPIYDYIMAGGTKAVKISDLKSQREIHRTEFYQDFFKPVGLEYQIQLPLPGQINALSVNRDRDFDPAVVEWLQLASEHIALAHANARRFSLLESAMGVNRSPSRHSPLTARETEVLAWMREGKRNQEIATILGISLRTVEKHVENILRKTFTETRTAATRNAGIGEQSTPNLDGTSVIERP